MSIKIDSNKAALLKFIRMQRNTSIDDLLKKLNISRDEYLRYENNKEISNNMFFKICKILNWKYKVY